MILLTFTMQAYKAYIVTSPAVRETADPHLMQRVLANFTMNAVQVMPPGGN